MDRKRTQKARVEVSFKKPYLSVQCIRRMLRLRTKRGLLAWFLVHSESNLPETVTPNVKDKFNFRSIRSLNSKLQKGVFKDVISSMHLKTILKYFRVRSSLLELLCRCFKKSSVSTGAQIQIFPDSFKNHTQQKNNRQLALRICLLTTC